MLYSVHFNAHTARAFPWPLRLRAAQVVARIAAWLKDWRALETVLAAMQSAGVGYDKRRELRAGRCALGMLDTGDAIVAREVGSYLGMPGCFVGVPGLRVVFATSRVQIKTDSS